MLYFTGMSAGRPPKHAFNTLEIGEKAELKGKARKFPYQFAYQYKKNSQGCTLKIIRDGKKVFAERIK